MKVNSRKYYLWGKISSSLHMIVKVLFFIFTFTLITVAGEASYMLVVNVKPSVIYNGDVCTITAKVTKSGYPCKSINTTFYTGVQGGYFLSAGGIPISTKLSYVIAGTNSSGEATATFTATRTDKYKINIDCWGRILMSERHILT